MLSRLLATVGIRTRSVIAHEAAKLSASTAQLNLSRAESQTTTLINTIKALDASANALRLEAEAVKQREGWYGRDDEIQAADAHFREVIALNSSEISPDELTRAHLAGHISASQYSRMVRIIERQRQHELGGASYN